MADERDEAAARYARFREMAGAAGQGAKLTLGSSVEDSVARARNTPGVPLNDPTIRGKFAQFLGNHPGAEYAVNVGLPAMSGATPAGVNPFGSPQMPVANGEQPPVTDRPSYPYGNQPPPSALEGAPVKVPGAEGLHAPTSLLNTTGIGGGVGYSTDDLGGRGTDKRILGSMDDQYAEMGGLQEKKGEEASAHIDFLHAASDTQGYIAEQRRKAQGVYERTVAEEDRDEKHKEDEVLRVLDEVSAMGVDPGRYYRNRDTLTTIQMTVGAVASGMLSALNGREGNPFLDRVREEARSDVNAQEKAIDQGWKRAKGMETSYERMRMRGVDRVNASLKQYDLTLAAVENDVAARLGNAKIPEIKANLEAGLQAIQIERAGVRTKIEEYAKNIRAQRAAAAAAAAERMYRHALETAKFRLEERKVNAAAEKDLADAGKARAEAGKLGAGDDSTFYPMGDVKTDPMTGMAYQEGMKMPSEAMLKDLSTQRATGESYVKDLNEFITMRETYEKLEKEMAMSGGTRVDLWPRIYKIRQDLISKGGHLTTQYGHNEHLGSLDKGLQEHAGTVQGEAVSPLPDTTIRAKQMRDTAIRSMKVKEESIRGQREIRVINPKTGRPVVMGQNSFVGAPDLGTTEELPGFKPTGR
jgi:hypothetical protein